MWVQSLQIAVKKFQKIIPLNCFFPLSWKYFKKITWIWSHHLHLQWKFRLWAGNFTWGNKAKHCWVMPTTFLFSKVCWQHPAMFRFVTSSKLFSHDLNFHWRWKWWDWIQTIFLNIFYFILMDARKTLSPICTRARRDIHCRFCFRMLSSQSR